MITPNNCHRFWYVFCLFLSTSLGTIRDDQPWFFNPSLRVGLNPSVLRVAYMLLFLFVACRDFFRGGGPSLLTMGMGQYLLIPFLVGWTSIYQLFWGSLGVQGFDPSPMTTYQPKTWKQTLSCGKKDKQVPLVVGEFHQVWRWMTLDDVG